MDWDGLGLGCSNMDFGFFRDNGAFDEQFFGTLVDVSKSEGPELTAIDGIAEMNWDGRRLGCAKVEVGDIVVVDGQGN